MKFRYWVALFVIMICALTLTGIWLFESDFFGLPGSQQGKVIVSGQSEHKAVELPNGHTIQETVLDIRSRGNDQLRGTLTLILICDSQFYTSTRPHFCGHDGRKLSVRNVCSGINGPTDDNDFQILFDRRSLWISSGASRRRWSGGDITLIVERNGQHWLGSFH